MLLESDEQPGVDTGVRISSVLVKLSADGEAQVFLSNTVSLTHKIPQGTEIGTAEPVEIVESDDQDGRVLSVGSGEPIR